MASIQGMQVALILKANWGKQGKELIGIEVGTKAARTTKMILEYPLVKKLYTIDSWKHFPGLDSVAGKPQEYHDEQKRIALETLKPFGNRVKVLHMDCDEAYKHIPEQVDFVWIDGHHTEEQVTKDINNYLPLVNKKKGVIGGHDYGSLTHTGVKKAVDRIFAGHRIFNGCSVTWWVQLGEKRG